MLKCQFAKGRALRVVIKHSRQLQVDEFVYNMLPEYREGRR